MERNSKGQYLKGSVPHNKGKRMEEYIPPDNIAKIKKTQFKKGSIPPNIKPKGYVSGRRHYRNGVLAGIDWVINIDWHGNRHTSYNYRKYLWEVENQQDAPKNVCFVALNGDQTTEPTLNNIEMISRQELIKRNNPKLR